MRVVPGPHGDGVEAIGEESQHGLLVGFIHERARVEWMREKLAPASGPREARRGKGTGVTMRRSRLVLVVAALLAGCSQPAPERPADLVVYGRVWTGDSAVPTAAGSRRARRDHRGRRLEASDRPVPGPGDAGARQWPVQRRAGVRGLPHALHQRRVPVDVGGPPRRRHAGRVRPASRGVREAVAAGQWILGGDWDHERWPGAPLPRKEWIDSVTPDHPVFVSRLDGHMGVANSAALRLARITRASRAPQGGEIVRDPATGEPTGLLKDNAMDPIWRAVPGRTPAGDRQRAGGRAPPRRRELASPPSTRWTAGATWRRSSGRAARNALTARIYAFVPLSTWKMLADTVRADGRGDDWLRWGGLKGFMDGSLGSTTAAFFDPYLDAPEHPRPARHRFGHDARLDHLGRQRRPPGRRSTPSATVPTPSCSTSMPKRHGCTARGTAASASSTPSTSGRPTSRASASRASSR